MLRLPSQSREAYLVKRIGAGLAPTLIRFTLHASRTLCLLMISVVVTGCVRRSLTIRSEPPGALVYVNDQLIGESPVTYDFTWYGWHRVILRKQGYDRLDDHQQLRAPLYLWIPLDLVMELLPFPIRDARTWVYTLIPSAAPPIPEPPKTTADRPQTTEEPLDVPR